MSNKGFKPGDLVVCMNAEESGEVLEYGRKYEVARSDNNFTYLEGFGSSLGFYHSRFEPVENLKKPEETPKPQFKVDDLVEYIGDSDVVIGLHKGAVYKIYNLCFGGYVRLYEFMHGPTFELKKFKPHKSPKELNKPQFKVGDLVVCVDDISKTKYITEGYIYKILRIDIYQFIYLEEVEGIRFNKSRFKLYEKPKEEIKPQFKVGDIVEAFGCEGRVVNVFNDAEYPIEVKFENDTQTCWFIKGGKYQTWHKIPSLVLVSRPKKKVTKTVEAWTNIYPDGRMSSFSDKVVADELAISNRIACVKLTGTYEIEVEKED